jgi:hypothetical protein
MPLRAHQLARQVVDCHHGQIDMSVLAMLFDPEHLEPLDDALAHTRAGRTLVVSWRCEWTHVDVAGSRGCQLDLRPQLLFETPVVVPVWIW